MAATGGQEEGPMLRGTGKGREKGAETEVGEFKVSRIKH